MNPPRIVVAGVIERGGYILVSQRPEGSGWGGYWEFPGGKQESGEDDRQTLARELDEELGIEVDIGDLISTADAPPLELRFYRCGWRLRQRPRPLLVSQFRWVRPDQIGALDFPPADDDLVARLVAGEWFE